MLERPLVFEDQLSGGLVILAQHAHDLLGLGDLGESSEPAQVQIYDRDFASMAFERVLGAAADDQLRELGREEAPQSADALELRDLLGNTPLQRSVPFLHFGGERFYRIVQALDSEHRAHARGKRGVIHRFGQVLVAAGLETRDDILRIRHRGHHDDRSKWEFGVRAQAPAHLEAVELGHHDVEKNKVRGLLPGGRQALLSVARGDDLVAFGSEPGLQDLDVGRIVVDDEDARRSSHRRCPSEQCNIRARTEVHKDRAAADQRAILIQKFVVSGAS